MASKESDPLIAKDVSVASGNQEDIEDPGAINSAVFTSLRILEPRTHTLHDGVSPLRSGDSTFWNDVKYFNPGSMPHSTVVGTFIGVMCGILAYIYYTILEWLLAFLWKTLPEAIVVPNVPESLHFLWIPALGYVMAIGVGLSVQVLGEPGDLSYTVQCVHDKAYIEMSHVLPMLGASQFSILGGGSLGPEAPLVAICASFSGFVSRKVFGMTQTNLIRKHTLMGMSSALAAFFGVPLGGSLFALEINNRFGIE
jgi:H+/Cl- antiporter ClcA